VSKIKVRTEGEPLTAESYVVSSGSCEDCENLRRLAQVKNLFCSQSCEVKEKGPMSDRKIQNIETRMLVRNPFFFLLFFFFFFFSFFLLSSFMESGCCCCCCCCCEIY